MSSHIKKQILSALVLACSTLVFSQNPGDTIKVKTFHYGSNNRDTTVMFPSGNLTYEKIILKYNMRCKNAQVSNSSNRNLGCGEWDYSNNTFIVDSSKIETENATTPNYVITDFTGSSFDYTNKPVYDYYDYSLSKVTVNSVSNENSYTLGTGTKKLGKVLKTDEKSGKTQILVTNMDFYNAGYLNTDTAISGISLFAANGGTTNFLKIRIKITTATEIDYLNPDLNGFTEVYNNSFTFVSGENKIIFSNPFKYNGGVNLIIELSFTNTNPSSPILLLGDSALWTKTISANNNFALDLSSSGHVLLDATKMSTVNQELSIGFWAFGDAKSMPTTTSVIYAYGANKNERQLNIHFPWSDNNIYFDCGYAAGSYDRINKAALADEQGGKWNYWMFTKNASTGKMSIYLNGVLWLSGTAKTKSMNLLNLILGKDQDLNNNYKGKISELSIWNMALDPIEIRGWMNRKINSTHPNFSNLVAYYPMSEGAGLSIKDEKFNLVSKGKNLQWTYDRGVNLSHSFEVTGERPNIKFWVGNYNVTNTAVVERDSVMRKSNTVEKYSIVSNSGNTPVMHDLVKLDTSYAVWEATPSKIFKALDNSLLGTKVNAKEGTLAIANLNYVRRYPFYNELISFVTPYGIGIDLGAKGKSWYFDMTDYAPILKGNKRIVMTMGGQNQEQMDLEFYFIVGTPPRNVLEFNQIWQGGARLGGPSIASILNNSRFPAVSVPILASGKEFKMRSTITGHGSEGEFEQNGGSITHYLNFNGGNPEFDWSLNIDCSKNPIPAQGGTWLIPRQGWCPGERSLLKESNVTPNVTPGSNATIDYQISNPDKPTGDYRYIVAHQLVTYSDLNHNLDARIVDIKAPSDNVLYAKTNPICSQPVLLVQNSGKTKITNIQFSYWVNNASVKQTWTWNGTLNSMDTLSIKLPIFSLWSNGLQASNNKFNAEIIKVNGVADDYMLNNKLSSVVTIPDVLPAAFTLEVKTNNNPTENTVSLYDTDGNVVSTNSYTVANKIYAYPFTLNGCYKLVVTDKGLDGLNWWANTQQGTGVVRIKNSGGTVIKTFNMDFGSFFEYNFTTTYALNDNILDLNTNINLYPNPSKNKYILEGIALENADIRVYDIFGKTIQNIHSNQNQKIEFNNSTWSEGVYFVEIQKGTQKVIKKIIKS